MTTTSSTPEQRREAVRRVLDAYAEIGAALERASQRVGDEIQAARAARRPA
jgi:hypothetical protein